MIVLLLLTIFTLACLLPMAYAFYDETPLQSLQKLKLPTPPAISDVIMMLMILFMAHVLLVTLIAGVLLHNTSMIVMLLVSLGLSLLKLSLFKKYMHSASSRVIPLRNFFAVVSPYTKGIAMKILLALFIIQIGVSTTRIIIAPPNVFDTQVYHLAIPLSWLHDGFITLSHDVPVERFNYATKLSKALSLWYLRFGGPIEGVELSQISGYILLLASSFSLLRSLKTSPRWALIGTILLASIPIIVIETTTLQDHLLLTSLHFALIALFFSIHDRRINPRMAFFALALTTSLLLASKFSSPAHVAVIWGICGVFFLQENTRVIRSTSWSYLVAGIVSMVGMGGIWYIANYIHYGSLFGPKHAQSTQSNIFLKNILAIPFRFFDNGHRYTPDLIGISGFGPHVASFGLVGTISAVLARYELKKIGALLISSGILLGIYFTQYFTLYNYRLFIFVPVMLLIISIAFLSKLSAGVQRLLLILIPIGMLYTLVMTIYPDYHVEPLRVYRDLLEHYPHSRTAVRFDYASDKFKNDASWLFIDQFIPESEPIVYITQNEGVGYDDNVIVPYYGQDLSRRIYWGGNVTASKLVTPSGYPTASLLPYMTTHGIHYIHNNTVFYYKPVEFHFEETPLIQLTPRLWYLP